jgi:hypothetical protein
LAIALAALFGAADQFLGARASVVGSWATAFSLLSAPWLLIAFSAGWSQPTVRRAVILGFICPLAALVGYWAMTLSPIEGAVVTARGIRGLLVGQSSYVVGALLTGPLLGWFGHRWRETRDRGGALIAALLVCFEPLAHAAVGTSVSFSGVWAAEIVAGLALGAYVVASARRRTLV